MRALLAFIFLLCINADETTEEPDKLVSEWYYNEGIHNVISGHLTFSDPTLCTTTINRQLVYTVLDEAFEEFTGVGVVRFDDENERNDNDPEIFDFDLDQDGPDGILDSDFIADDFDLIKYRIKHSMPCPDETIEVTNLFTLHSQIIQGRPPHDRQRLFSIFGRRNLDSIPNEVSYVSDIGPIRNQGGAGSCAAFSADALFQYYDTRDNGVNKEWSPKFFYYHRCMNDWSTGGRSPCGAGMVIEWIGGLVTLVGNVYEEECPYVNVNDWTYEDSISASTKKKALEVIPDYTQPDGSYDEWICFKSNDFGIFDEFKVSMKAYLSMYGPMIFGVNVYDHRHCDIWNAYGSKKLGGHAMVVIAYDNEGVLIRNSWGTGWCDRGSTKMSWWDAYTRTLSFCLWEKPESGSESYYAQLCNNCYCSNSAVINGIDWKDLGSVSKGDADACYQKVIKDDFCGNEFELSSNGGCYCRAESASFCDQVYKNGWSVYALIASENRCPAGYEERAPTTYTQAPNWSCCYGCPQMKDLTRGYWCDTDCKCICTATTQSRAFADDPNNTNEEDSEENLSDGVVAALVILSLMSCGCVIMTGLYLSKSQDQTGKGTDYGQL